MRRSSLHTRKTLSWQLNSIKPFCDRSAATAINNWSISTRSVIDRTLSDMSFDVDASRHHIASTVVTLSRALAAQLVDAGLPWSISKCRVLSPSISVRFSKRTAISNVMYDSATSLERQVRAACSREPDLYARRIDDLLATTVETIRAQPAAAALVANEPVYAVYIMCDAFVDRHLVAANRICHSRSLSPSSRTCERRALVIQFATGETTPPASSHQPVRTANATDAPNTRPGGRQRDGGGGGTGAMPVEHSIPLDVSRTRSSPSSSSARWSLLSAPFKLIRGAVSRGANLVRGQ